MKELLRVFLYIVLSVLIIFVLLVVCDSALLYPFEKTEYVVVRPGTTIAYNELNDPPVYFSDYIAPITKTKLKLYMLVHNLEITSGEYSFENTIRFERLVEILNFADADEVVENDISETQTEYDENDSFSGAYVEYGQEYQGDWYSEDGYINFTVDETFNSNDGCGNLGKYTFNDTTYDIVVDFITYNTDEYYDGYIDVFLKSSKENVAINGESIICGEYKLNSRNDTITVIAVEPDTDRLPPTYDDSRSVYRVGDKVVFKKH